MTHSFIPYGKQALDEEDIEAVNDVLHSDYITTGPKVDAFEQAVADYVGASYAVSFSNGTAALHAACFAAGVGKEDEVITTPMTFAASANCVLYQGGVPVFADIDPDTYTIDPEEIEKKITSRTKAIIPVDYTGQPAELDTIKNIAERYGLIVIEDAAHAIGATYQNKPVGSISDMTMFSFHPVKHITTGEGGMITTNDPVFVEQLKQFRSHGITRDRKQLEEDHGPWYYDMQFLGFNYRMTDIQAALGLSQLKKLDAFIERRKQIAETYNKAFSNEKEIITPYQDLRGESSWHLYIIKLKEDLDRKKVFEQLRNKNIGVNVHYIPVHLFSYYQTHFNLKWGMYPVSEELYKQLITLPLHPSMSKNDIEYVISTVRKVSNNL
ncbi:UDP-4-amino-4,6-dideoxy-N-acetyl-beta-L-altrosamine transaminase [Salibacterium sp. K-3]